MIDNQVCNVLRMVVIKLSASRHKAITVYICLWWTKSNTVYPIKGSNSIGQPLSMGNEGEPSREQICHSVFTLSSNTFCWFSWESCSQTKLCCSFSCWSLAFLIWNCSSSFAALSFRIWKMQNELVKAFESDYSSCTSMQDLPPPHPPPSLQTSWDKHGNHTFFVFAETALSLQWKHKCTQIWWMLNGWGKWCLLMNNTESIIFFSGSLGKSCSQVVDKYFNACLPFGRLRTRNNCYNHCKWARDSNRLFWLWGSQDTSSEANPALICLQLFREQNHWLTPTWRQFLLNHLKSKPWSSNGMISICLTSASVRFFYPEKDINI